MRAGGAESKVDILIVDDQRSNLLALEAILADLGQNLVWARSGEEALALVAEKEFAVILLDVRMDGLDGFETAGRIRAREGSRQTPILFVTAYEDDPDYPPEAAYALGAVDYLVKPLVPVILRAKVAGFIDLLRKTWRAEEAEAAARQQLSQVLATVNDLFMSFDRDLRFTHINDRMLEVSGFAREEVVGKPLLELFPHAADSLLERELRRCLKTNTPAHFEFHDAVRDRWFDNRVYPSADGLMVVATEITGRKRDEEAIRHLAAIVESSDDAIFSLDLDGTITSWNQGAERLYGYASDEVIGRRVSLLTAADRPDDWAQVVQTIRSGESIDRYETRRQRKDGRIIDVSLVVSPVRNTSGEIVGASKIARDVTERKRAEEHQRLLAEAGRILGSSLDYESTLADVCRLVVPGFADWCALDLRAEDGLPRRVCAAHRDPAMVELAHELRRRYPPRLDDAQGLMTVLRSGEPVVVPHLTDEMLVQGAKDEGHLELLRRLGLRSALIVPMTVSGRTLGALTLVMAESSRQFDEADSRVATQVAARAALAVENAQLFAETQQAVRVRDEALALHRAIEEKLTLLVEASGSLSISLNLPSVLDAALALSRQLIAADAYAIWRYRPEAGRWGIELASGLSEDYQRATISLVTTTPSMPYSAIIAEDVHATPLLGPRAEDYEREGIASLMSVPLVIHGSVSGTLAFYYRDRHHFTPIEIRAATALSNLAGSAIRTAELYEELRENDKRKDEFLAMLAHELRNPLSAISSAVRLARQTNEDEEREWSTEVIERQAGKLARLIDDLLDVSRITRGKIELKKEIIDARRVLQSAVDAVRPLIDERKHDLTVSTGPGALRLEADPVRLEQILINLLSNAAKYTGNGGHIWATVERKDSALVFTVRDNGAGIAPEVLPKMFELFAQGEQSLARSEGGLGIGLTLVRKLTEMHGGSVSAQSEGVGQGSVFTVRLPAVEEGSNRDELAPGAGEPSSRRVRVLVVDDSVDNARGLARLLKLLGHDVATAHDGPSGLEAAQRLRPGIILLDIGLPGMSGYEVAERLRREDYGRDALIIAVTGYGQDEDRRRSREAGFDHHLVKPIDHKALVMLLPR